MKGIGRRYQAKRGQSHEADGRPDPMKVPVPEGLLTMTDGDTCRGTVYTNNATPI